MVWARSSWSYWVTSTPQLGLTDPSETRVTGQLSNTVLSRILAVQWAKNQARKGDILGMREEAVVYHQQKGTSGQLSPLALCPWHLWNQLAHSQPGPPS